MLQQVDPNLEHLKIGFTFVGTLLGATIGAPLVEWFKDKLGSRRQWEAQRSEIVGTIRLISGIFDAFDELRKEALGYSENIEFSLSGFARLSQFDFTLLNASLEKLSALHPEDSRRSAVAQRLIQHIVVVKSHFQQLQTLVPISVTTVPTLQEAQRKYLSVSSDDAALVVASDQKFTAFQRFLVGLYARRLGIDTFSLVIDPEIMKFESDMRQYDLAQSQQKLRDAGAALGKRQNEGQ